MSTDAGRYRYSLYYAETINNRTEPESQRGGCREGCRCGNDVGVRGFNEGTLGEACLTLRGGGGG